MQFSLRKSDLVAALIILTALLSACQGSVELPPTPVEVSDGRASATATASAVPPATATDTVESPYPAGELETLTPPPTAPPSTAYPSVPQSSDSTTSTTDPYPDVASPTPPSGTAVAAGTGEVYLPVTGGSSITPTPPPTPTPAPTATPTPVPTIDVTAARAQLQAEGQDIGFVKMGFHVTLLEDRDLLDSWMNQLDAAGIPFFLKTVDNAEPLFRAQELAKASGVPHVLVYRASGGVPAYELPAVEAARLHWTYHRENFPPELDPNMVWVETLNEVDRTRAEWLGQFALETARLAMADGFRWAAFGWASGEPEPEQWTTPSMLQFLRLAGENPDRLAIALHEYSYLGSDIGHEYPYKVGRFQELFRIVDELGIPRPTVLITEWGWEYADIPDVGEAMEDVRWASKMYAPYPEVKGAAIWNLGLGCCYDDISDQVTELIDPLLSYSLTRYFTVPAATEKLPVDPERHRP